MKAFTPGCIDTLLRRYESPRIGIRRVQAVNNTVELLKLAGFTEPLDYDWYDVPVRENALGQLEVNVPRPGQGTVSHEARPSARLAGRFAALRGCWRLLVNPASPEELAEWLAGFDSVPTSDRGKWPRVGPVPPELEHLARQRFRVEVRLDNAWIVTLIVDAEDKGRAGDEAMRLAFREWGARACDFDVWSVISDEDPAVGVESAAGVSSGSEPTRAPEDAALVSGPGLARHSSPAFAVSGNVPGSGKSALADSGRPENPASVRTERRVAPLRLAYVAASEGVSSNGDVSRVNRFAHFCVYEAEGEGCDIKLPINQLAGLDPNSTLSKRYRVDLELTPLADGEPLDFSPRGETERRRFRVRIDDDRYVELELTGFYNAALPVPHEAAAWECCPLDDAAVHGAIAALHKCRPLSDYEVSPA